MKKTVIFIPLCFAIFLGFFLWIRPRIVETLISNNKSPSPIVESNSAAATSLVGTINRFTRPEPDIAYDYQIILSTSVIDTENASGLNQSVGSYVVVPGSEAIKQQLEKSVDKLVTLEGDMKWGYAESKYFSVSKVTLK